MSPLQYQKALRPHEARQLMLFQKVDASDACHRVGYWSRSRDQRFFARDLRLMSMVLRPLALATAS
jgi:AraC-like DNA-binding protein